MTFNSHAMYINHKPCTKIKILLSNLASVPSAQISQSAILMQINTYWLSKLWILFAVYHLWILAILNCFSGKVLPFCQSVTRSNHRVQKLTWREINDSATKTDVRLSEGINGSTDFAKSRILQEGGKTI